MKTTRKPTVNTFSLMEVMMMMSLIGTMALWANQSLQKAHVSMNPIEIKSLIQTESNRLIAEFEATLVDCDQFFNDHFGFSRLKNESRFPALPLPYLWREKTMESFVSETKQKGQINSDFLAGSSQFKFFFPPRETSR